MVQAALNQSPIRSKPAHKKVWRSKAPRRLNILAKQDSLFGSLVPLLVVDDTQKTPSTPEVKCMNMAHCLIQDSKNQGDDRNQSFGLSHQQQRSKTTTSTSEYEYHLASRFRNSVTLDSSSSTHSFKAAKSA